jgi:hypothetical protein
MADARRNSEETRLRNELWVEERAAQEAHRQKLDDAAKAAREQAELEKRQAEIALLYPRQKRNEK